MTISKQIRRLHSDESGQVLWLFVMCGMALVVLAGLVFNTGKQATRKMEMQNAVDAAVISGGMWYARGLNIISMNNVAMTHTLGLIANLRALQQAAKINRRVLEIQQGLSNALKASAWPPTVGAGWALQAGVWFGDVPTEIVTALDGIQILDELAKPPKGLLWEFMQALSDFSGVMTKAAPGLGIVQTINVGRQNIPGLQSASSDVSRIDVERIDLPEGAILLPNLKTGSPWLPVAKGTFNELCDPTEWGSRKANKSSAVDRRGYDPLLGYEVDHGPFQKYKEWATTFWSPSVVTGIPEWYGKVADYNLHVLCGSGESAPRIEVREKDLAKARRLGAQKFVWNYTSVRTYKDDPREIIVDVGTMPAPPVNFSPKGFSQEETARREAEARKAAEEGREPPETVSEAESLGYEDPRVDPDHVYKRERTKTARFTPPDDFQFEGEWRWKKVMPPERTTIDYPEDPPVQATYVTTFGRPGEPPGQLQFSRTAFDAIHEQCRNAHKGDKWFIRWDRQLDDPVSTQAYDRLKSLESHPDAYTQISCPTGLITAVAVNTKVAKGESIPVSIMKTVRKDYLVFTEERWTFLYAYVEESFDELDQAQDLGSRDSYPQPYHLTVDGRQLREKSQLDPSALQTLQYVAVAYKQADDPWLEGLTVSVRNKSHAIFKNPNESGWLTYAQVQVYNPTSWDLYTQNWHVKLVPATSLDQILERASSSSPLLSKVSLFIKVLNAH